MKGKFIVLVLLLTVLLALVSGCGSKVDQEEVKSYANPIAEDILQGMKNSDYEQFSKHFSDTLKGAITKESFEGMKTQFDTYIGDYVSKEFEKADIYKDYIRVFYTGKYTNEPKDVVITLYFSNDDGPLVEGINFKSPNLLKMSQ